jgi:hypothetical protein
MMPHLVAWLHDLLLFSLFAGLAYGVVLLAPQKREPIQALSMLLMTVIGSVMAVYPQTLREYLSFPVNIFSSDSSSIKVTLIDYLGLQKLWPALVTLLLVAVTVSVPVRNLPWRLARLALVPFVLLSIMTLPRSPHPFIHSIKQYAIAAFEKKGRVVPSLHRPTDRGATSAQSAALNLLATSQQLTADRVFIIVLEGISSADFESRFLASNSRFLAKMHGNYTYFKNYHTTNLDSYTSLIAMLTSKQVPYRCYADVRLYDAVNKTENVTATLRNRGYYNLFVSTCAYHPFVPVRTSWDRIMIRKDLRQQDGWATVGSSRMEEAVEDRAAISAIVETVAAHPKTVVMHELIYGHTTEWQAKTGMTPLDYYDRYLAELFDTLKSRGLDKRSLFVVVSDHGDRSKPSQADNYRVPLLIAGAGVRLSVDTRFRNHLDLQGITAASLTGTALPAAREKVFTVGSTERWIYGELRANGEYLFIDDSIGTVLHGAGSLTPKLLQQEFQQYINQFGTQYGN